ncbi:Glycosyltransferase [Heracleum sosnowskyi]|uniref:Glycosyltransferase n=1 Tax=Heracleum sosnowskyi TaxID=360622 RepID=A0AAD8ICW8_9APIA|nr:Glycosyltransferase [Heracleum sosnowskyi]
MDDKKLHIAMYPWFAMGHLTSFFHLSNKFAERGHTIFFFVPSKTLQKLEQFNLHRDLITFIPITVPHVEGLPPGAETTADIAYPMQPYLMTAMDMTQPTIEAFLKENKPQFVFFDFTHWLPSVAHPLGIKTIHYCTISSAATGYLIRETGTFKNIQYTEADLMEPPPGFPPSSMIKLYADEARQLSGAGLKEYGKNISFSERVFTSLTECDAIAFKTCRELEGPYCEYIENHFKRPILLAGPVVPEKPTSKLDEKWEKWLDACKPNSVIFCSFGSECILRRDQFEELLLGFELTDLPFLAALRPPVGVESIEAALPEGFNERTQERGVVHGGWMQQQLLLAHPSVGCFVTHCGYGSLSESLVNKCQLVLLPSVGDQFINARVMGRDLKVGVEVEKGEDGVFTKHSIRKAIQSVMDVDSEVGKEVRENHSKFRELLLRRDFEDSYIDGFVKKMKGLLQ